MKSFSNDAFPNERLVSPSRFRGAIIVAALPLVLLSAPSAHAADPCYGFPVWEAYVQGQPAARFMKENGITGILSAFDLGVDGPELAALLTRLNDNPGVAYDDVPDDLQGIGGFIATLFLQKYLDQDGNPVGADGEPIADKVLRGKIRDYILVKDTENTGNGHISVDMCTENATTDARQFFHWDVEVGDNQFMIQSEMKSPDPMRPELKHKLGAKGQAIKIKSVYIRDAANPNLTLIDRGPPGAEHPFYKETDENCIDLFTEGVPPETYGELNQSEYCLGRCANPFIVNTGD